MAETSSLTFEKSILWKTRLPKLAAEPTTSPSFLVQGSEWHLDISCRRRSDCRALKIIVVSLSRTNAEALKKCDKLENSFKVSTFIQRDDHILLPSNANLISRVELGYQRTRIARFEINILDEHFGYDEGIFIVCRFHLPASDVSLQNEKRSEDKCTQAYFDASCDLDSLSLDLCNLLSCETFEPDVVARCGDRTTHMAILAARSEALAAMFQDKMAESETGAVEIPNMDAPDFDLFLRFVNSGNIQLLSEDSASRLYAAGDKYGLPSLKKACSDFMVGNLKLKNCLRFLAMSGRHCDEALKEAALIFVSENLDGLPREKWSSFSEECPKLALKVYEKRFEATLTKQVSDTQN